MKVDISYQNNFQKLTYGNIDHNKKMIKFRDEKKQQLGWVKFYKKT